jgi:hypothetical protein
MLSPIPLRFDNRPQTLLIKGKDKPKGYSQHCSPQSKAAATNAGRYSA